MLNDECSTPELDAVSRRRARRSTRDDDGDELEAWPFLLQSDRVRYSVRSQQRRRRRYCGHHLLRVRSATELSLRLHRRSSVCVSVSQQQRTSTHSSIKTPIMCRLVIRQVCSAARRLHLAAAKRRQGNERTDERARVVNNKKEEQKIANKFMQSIIKSQEDERVWGAAG